MKVLVRTGLISPEDAIREAMQLANQLGKAVIVLAADDARRIAYALPQSPHTWLVGNDGYSFIVETPAGAFIGAASMGIGTYHAAMVGAPVASDAPVEASVQLMIDGLFQSYPQPVQSFPVLWGAQDTAGMVMPSGYDSRYMFQVAISAGDAAAQFVAAYGTPSDSQTRVHYALV